ncbi:pyrroloquinoline quinone biosynthesis protein PqqB [Pseudosulfitobacter koreensis]|uniref:Coenzyme PQQ synthesis protein B n=1 Tax=Pseudosulfitobacter koreensis TaxID=2968472 RepID=A0ABT1YZP0_9RHOB|nr:pyrroloquinoline quinone biosynthesis protein PqqB [Pseudosulfitobacter koreense]MCR8826355.1 pyrroloquinoline quinone biosynthesis protein PqqB [Pseudosulfitobacter koreense]
MTLRALVLGAAAGGGLPQWNCGCENCNLAREGAIPPQSQSSLAFSTSGAQWAILNASPDIREQIRLARPLHPTDKRQSPISSVLLTNGDIDHIAGLLTLREQQRFTLFATQEIHRIIAQNPIFEALNPDYVSRVTIALDQPVEIAPGLTAQLFAVPGKVPLYLESGDVHTDLEGEQTVGVHLRAEDRNAFYIPGCAAMRDDLKARLEGADMVFFDGTLWQDDEMIQAGLSQKTGRRMGHMSMSGPDGSMAAFQDIAVGQKAFVHMNNTNPVFRPNSAERQQVEAAGWIVAHDGMELEI